MATVFKNQLQTGIGPIVTISGATAAAGSPSSGSVTYTFSTQASTPFTVGSYISVAGASIAGFNGPFGPVTAATASSVTVANSTTGAPTGTISITGLLFSSNSAAKTTVIGFSLTNTTGLIVTANVQLIDTVVGTTANFISNVILPTNQSLRIVTGGEKLILGPSTNVLVSCNQASSLDAVLSFVEIS